jgi:hypothetical protein
MKHIKLTALFLSAAMLLCSCGKTEATSAEDTMPETTTQAAVVAETAAVSQTAAISETIATAETTAKAVEEVTLETANKNAEIVFENAAEYSERLIAAGEVTAEFYFDLSSMNDELLDSDNGSEILVTVPELNEDIGGVYIIINGEGGHPLVAIWASSLESNLIGIYPENESFGVRKMFESEDGEDALGEPLRISLLGYIEEENTRVANANAKLVFQNAATYVTKAQIYGASFDSLLISGSLTEKYEERPQVESGETLTGKDFTNALRYYMGGPDSGVYVILLDEQFNPIAALWAKDEESSVVGAYPVARTARDNETGNITTADIYEAAGD